MQYKFVVIEQGCGQSGYDIPKCENITNQMGKQGWRLIQVYKETTPGCGGGKSALVLIFCYEQTTQATTGFGG